jgi:hypothetical protein
VAVCQAQIVRNDANAALKTANELLALSEEHGLPQTRAAALVYLGWAMGQADDAPAGMQRVEQGSRHIASSGSAPTFA